MNTNNFIIAASEGNLQEIDRLIDLYPSHIFDMVSADNFKAFRLSAAHGHFTVIDKLIALALNHDKVQEMIGANKFQAFREAASNGHLAIIERLVILAQDSVLDMVRAEDFILEKYGAFKLAVSYGHLHVMDKLISLAHGTIPDEVQNMVSSDNFHAFQLAASHGHLAVMERLIELAQGKVPDMVRARDFYAFQLAASQGHLAIVDRLMRFPAVLAYAENHAHKYACDLQRFINHHLANLSEEINTFHTIHPNEVFNVTDSTQAKSYFYMMRNLIRQKTDESLNQLHLLLSIPSVIEATPNQSNELLRLALSLYNPKAAQRLLEINAVRDLAKANHFYLEEQRNGLDVRTLMQISDSGLKHTIFINAASEGHIQEIDRLVNLNPAQIYEMISEGDFGAFQKAVENGHIEIVEKLIALASGKVQDMVSSNNFNAFRKAVENGHLIILEKLITLAPKKVMCILRENNFGPFQKAVKNNHVGVIERLMHFPEVFAYAANHAREYASHVTSFMQHHFVRLKHKIDNFHPNHPHDVFNITDAEQIQLYFHMITTLIRHKEPESLNQIQLLLRIPSVEACAHKGLNPNEPNHLLRFAKAHQNRGAAQMLINIDMVRALAQRYNFHQQDAHNGLDLRALIQERDDCIHHFMNAAKEGSVQEIDILVTQYPWHILDMISTDDFYAFRWAAQNGHIPVIERLIALAPEQVQDMISTDNFYAFRWAAQNGHIQVIERLIALAPEKVQDMISANNFKAFQLATQNGHLTVMQRLLELAPEKVQDMISANNFKAFQLATENGHLAVMQRLIELAPEQVQDMISADNFYAFQGAAVNGHLQVLDRLIMLSPNQVEDMVYADDFYAFRKSAENGHLAVMNRLIELTPEETEQDMLSNNRSRAFCWAAGNGHFVVIDRLIELAYNDKEVQDMVFAGGFKAFQVAAQNGHLTMIEKLITFVPKKIQEDMVSSHNFYAVRAAAQNGHLPVIEKLVSLAPDKVQEMLRSEQFGAFRAAAQNGHLAIMERLIELASDDIDMEDMVRDNDDAAFRFAAQNGQIEAMNRIMALVPYKVQNMISAANFEAFRWAARMGHQHVVEKLIALAPHKVHEMLCANNYEAFRWAAANGRLTIVKLLLMFASNNAHYMLRANDYEAFRFAAERRHPQVMKKLIAFATESNELHQMVSAANFYAFRGAAQYGHLQVIEKLVSLAPHKAQEMVRANDFEAFRFAAESGRLAVMERLMTLDPTKVQDMVCEDNFYAFQFAAKNGHIQVVERLLALTPDKVQDMVCENNCAAFRWAVQNDHLQVIKKLLHVPFVFAYAEMHMYEYEHHVQRFIKYQLTDLTHEMDDFHMNHPNEVFDITDNEQAKLYFYIMRNLIRQQTLEASNQLDLLLHIPSLIALAHQEVTPNQSNELLRLAISLNNQEVAQRLLTITAVRHLAEANHYYQHEQRNGLDLRALAQDRESSVRALTQGQQRALEEVEKKYQPEINARGVPQIMNELKALLAARFNANPATVKTGDGRVISLPLTFDDYQYLAKTLSADTRERALESYYKNADHTALRYLSKPNRWMSHDAQFVIRRQEGAWATFDGYQELISLLYLAAKDENTPAIDDYTIEGRVNNFIVELSLIGRAHNWDASRINPITGDSENYDDLQGDKPSCYSGVKRRLSESVQGHPLLTSLTPIKFQQEVHNAVREHFINSINNENCIEMQTAWLAMIERTDANISILEQLNFSKEHIESISQKLKDKYGASQFGEAENACLVKALSVDKRYINLAEKHGGLANLTKILENKIQEFKNKRPAYEIMREARVSFFTSHVSATAPDNDDLPNKRPRLNP